MRLGDDPRRIPWWWTYALAFYRQVKSILETSALDPEKLIAPKEYWFNQKELEAWYESRRNIAAGLPDGET